ncbi:MAG: menaquinone biosynthetic enzyme MqnA/MqnD family protein [Solitalea-like symbiont of Tyrophagus putrescentiae]
MSKLKLAVINYTNSLPFVYGLKNDKNIDDYFDILEDTPSGCSDKLLSNTVDVALVSVVTLLSMPYYRIIGDYCIGSNGEVKSVYIHSKKPIDKIQSLLFDNESRTSNMLAKIILSSKNKLEIEYISEQTTSCYDAKVLIGDKNFTVSEKLPYKYDLSQEWQKLTGKPFVFAVWLANKQIPEQHEKILNKALAYGIENKNECISVVQNKYSNIDVKEYLYKNIQYDLTKERKESLEMFLSLVKQFQ